MSLHLIMGPMFSGKTSEMMRIYRRAKIAKKTCLIIKYQHDQRYSQKEQLCTHDQIALDCISSQGNSLQKTIDSLPDSPLSQTKCWIFIDEIQFYTDAHAVCDQLANQGHHIIVTGLQGDSDRKLFPVMIDLIPLCDKITHLTAIDPINGQDAPFTVRLVDIAEQVHIGGIESYRPASRQTIIERAKN